MVDYLMVEALRDRLSDALAKAPGANTLQANGHIYAKLKASECLVIEAYRRSAGVTASGCDAKDGEFEFGLVLYWLHNPPGELKHLVGVLVAALKILEGGAALPASRIQEDGLYDDIVAEIGETGIPAPDGTLYGFGKYEQLDPGWLMAFGYFVFYQLDRDKIFQPLPQGDPEPIAAKGKMPGEISVAIVGDWGTGPYGTDGGPAIAVMDAIEHLETDYIVHMGDVYYAGTQGMLGYGEEKNHLVDRWPGNRQPGMKNEQTSFTLNSNHEMYDGANGYFRTALGYTGSAGYGLEATVFSAQKGLSYFALHFDPWVIVGMDTAYYSDPEKFFLEGNLVGGGDAQITWAQKHFKERAGKNVILMTHHNGLVFDSSDLELPLWEQVCDVFGDIPDYWYWGHVHDGIVYGDNSKAPAGKKLRCAGHGAIPYAKAWGLEGLREGTVDYYAHTSTGDGLKVRNGFAVITLCSDGSMREVFYEVNIGSNVPIAMWK